MSDEQLTLDQLLEQKNQQKIGHDKEVVDVNEKTIKVVIFSLGDECFAFYADSVTEILAENSSVFFVPGCPASLSGVINVRGSIESVIDIAMFLKLENQTNDKKTYTILLAKNPEMTSGVAVDKIIDVVDIPERIIQEAPDTIPLHLRPYISDVFEFDVHAVSLLNLEQIFKDYQQGLS